MMQEWMNEYYMSDEYEYALRDMQKWLERKRILVESRIVNQARIQLMEQYQSQAKELIQQTKITVKQVKGQIDTSIQGKIAQKLEREVDQKSMQYDQILLK